MKFGEKVIVLIIISMIIGVIMVGVILFGGYEEDDDSETKEISLEDKIKITDKINATKIDTRTYFELDTESKGVFDVEYSIRGGVVENMISDLDAETLVVQISALEKGDITLVIPKELVNAEKQDGKNDSFIVLIDGVEKTYKEEIIDLVPRVITINFNQGDLDIEIIGVYSFGGQRDVDPIKKENTKNERLDVRCNEYGTVEMNHSITSGSVEMICGDIDSMSTVIKLRDINLDSVLIIDVPYTMIDKNGWYEWDDSFVSIPLVTHENDLSNIFLLYDGREVVVEYLELIRQCQDYQTFEFDVPANTKYLEILISYTVAGYQYHGETSTTSLLEIQNNCKPTS